jgi:asparaginyl-tRNA synthetase
MKIYLIDNEWSNLLEKEVIVSGWVLTKRTQKDLTFIKLTDGSNVNGAQLISDKPIDEKINIGTSLTVKGKLVKSPAEGQLWEIQVNEINVLGYTDLDSYPLAKGRLPLDYLRNYAHLRTRTSSFGSIFRIKSAISDATHEFFKQNHFLHINPNIVTVNECEGGAGVFQLTERDITNVNNLPVVKETGLYDWSQDHFTKPAYLTVSSQLQLESLCCSLGSVYTTNKSFRSEHSSTSKHLTEFEHLEIEDAFISINDLMNTGENYIKFVASYLLSHCMDDIKNLGKFVSKGLEERIKTISNITFKRITYTEAIKLLSTAPLSSPINFGEDLNSESENWLTNHFKGPVFVSHWPLSIKSFYMKRNVDNPELCDNFDLLMPWKVGELIGGSMREDNLDFMLKVMKTKGVNPEPLQFYLDLRRFGTIPHGGFGLGFDRLTMMFTGMESIKDVVAFPVYWTHCAY